MRVSARNLFTNEDKDWNSYIQWIQLENLTHIRSIDAQINKYVEKCGDYLCSPGEIGEILEILPKIDNTNQYYLLATEIDLPIDPDKLNYKIKILGYDLADETDTSTILNCGRWENDIFRFKNNLNQFGLLNREDAIEISTILRNRVSKDPHNNVKIWLLSEIMGKR